MSSSNAINREIIYDILCEFMEVVIHNIIHACKLYPECIFAKRKKYGAIVYQSVHPDLNEYIKESLKAVRFHAKANQLQRIRICMINPCCTVIYQQFVFDLLSLKNEFEDDPICLKLEQNMRDFCLKLQNACSYLDDLPEDATFKIMLHTSELSNLEFNDDRTFDEFPWICLNADDHKIRAPDIVPLHTVATSCLNLQIYVEKCST